MNQLQVTTLKEKRNNMTRYFYQAKLLRVVDGDTIDALIDVGFDIWV